LANVGQLRDSCAVPIARSDATGKGPVVVLRPDQYRFHAEPLGASELIAAAVTDE